MRKAFPVVWKRFMKKCGFFTGFGGSNIIAVEGQDSCILIDSLNGRHYSLVCAKELMNEAS